MLRFHWTYLFLSFILFLLDLTHTWLCIAAPFISVFHLDDSWRLCTSLTQHVQPCWLLISMTHSSLYKLLSSSLYLYLTLENNYQASPLLALKLSLLAIIVPKLRLKILDCWLWNSEWIPKVLTDCRQLTRFKKETGINMERTNTGKVAFNCFGLDCLVPKADNPLKYAIRSGRKELSWAEEENGEDPDKVNVRLLP